MPFLWLKDQKGELWESQSTGTLEMLGEKMKESAKKQKIQRRPNKNRMNEILKLSR